MKAVMLILVVVAFAGGMFVSANFNLLRQAESGERGGEEPGSVVVAEEATKLSDETLEDRLVKTFKNRWSFRIEDGELVLTQTIPLGMKIEGCDYVKYGYEVYSIGSGVNGNGRLYKEGGVAIDGGGSSLRSPIGLGQLREMLGATEEHQRALVVRFWISPRGDSKIRYLVGEKLWDGNW